MIQILDIFTLELHEGQAVTLLNKKEDSHICEYELELTWTEENAARDDAFSVAWTVPMTGIQYCWNVTDKHMRNICPSYGGRSSSMISRGAPLDCFYDGRDNNRYCVALSEAQMLVRTRNGVLEATGELQLEYLLGTQQFTNYYHTRLIIRIDTRQISMSEVITDVVKWWEHDLGITPMYVPEDAKLPLYSFWYSYHRTINQDVVEAECRRAKDLGFEICIVDDGWQIDDEAVRGYPGTTEWLPAPRKFPDMAAHVQRVHDMGMKYILWFCVPFVSPYDPTYSDWEHRLLRVADPIYEAGVLDPRYKDVRDHLVEVYRSALVNWNLDGLKLDFIDQWNDSPENAPYNPEMDIPCLQDAVNCLMGSISDALRAIKPDVLIEFRQNYVGPHMRRFCNMFRVGDCPYDYVRNRVGVLDLRLSSGSTAVHSDMLMWHPDEAAENAALQIISVLFGVLQYSARLELLPERTVKMSRFWLSFMKNHRDLLLNGHLQAYEPHRLYTWAQSTRDDVCLAAVYGENTCIHPNAKSTVYLVNGSAENRVMCELEGKYIVQIMNCCGEEISRCTYNCSGAVTFPIPSGGLALLNRL